MRVHGLLNGPGEVVQADHACWVYDDEATFQEAARRFLTDGLARGERLLCVGDTDVLDRVRTAAGRPSWVDGEVARGALQFLPLTAVHTAGGPTEPAGQLAFYEAATRRAVDDGYRGLRVIAELTAVAATPAYRPALLRWELLADEFISTAAGLTALCAYRGDRLPDGVVAELASAHPLLHDRDDQAPFRLYSELDGLALAGTVDAFGVDRLTRVLAAAPLDRPVTRLDLRGLEFIDVAGCRALASWARELEGRSTHLHLTGVSRMFRRMWQLLGFSALTHASLEAPAQLDEPVACREPVPLDGAPA